LKYLFRGSTSSSFVALFYRTIEVPIENCVHFCGFRYGHGDYNPYESYATGLHSGESLDNLRHQFIDFLQHYRPRNMGQALGISLSKHYPLWLYPWKRFPKAKFALSNGWLEDPSQPPDILTHFSDRGILRWRIEEELRWMEHAYVSIKKEGYNPRLHRSYVTVRELRRKDRRGVFLLLDGNHRVSAMSALSFRSVLCKRLCFDIVHEERIESWFGVRKGYYTREDALSIFGAYFTGNHNYRTDSIPAPILGNATEACASRTYR
jgi:hypothetical protein